MPIPDFVVALREKVGHDLLWMPGVGAVVFRCIDGVEHILLVQRSDNHTWGPVTGIVDPGEHPHVTAVREVKEETGVDAEVEALCWVHAGEPMVHVNGDRACYLGHTFRLRWVAGEPVVGDDESIAVGWYPVDALPPMPPDRQAQVQAVLDYEGTVRLG